MKHFSIETIMDAYLISAPLEENGGTNRTTRPTLVDTKNLIFNVLGANFTAKEYTPEEGVETNYRNLLNFNVQELTNGFVLGSPHEKGHQEVKTYYATQSDLVKAIDELINKYITPEPK